MVEIQELFFILIAVMGVVGAVRGFLKELGVTLVLIATLFALDRLIPIVNNFVNGGGGFLSLGPVPETQTTDEILFVIFTAILIAATFIAYQGETLAYGGKDPKGILGVLLGFLIGAVNGYLLFGTLWWVANFYQYPFGLVTPPLQGAAQQIVSSGVLPLELLGGGPVDQSTWGLLPFVLILLVILRVIR